MDSLELPPGYRFYPSDTELLKFYLKPKLVGKKLPYDIAIEKQMYGPNANPWDVLDDSSTPWMIWDDVKTVYVFTPLTKKATSSSVGRGGGKKEKQNYVKKAGCGNWHGQTSREKIMEGGDVLGFRRQLAFQVNDVEFCLRNKVDFSSLGHWSMHEYVLCGFQDFAICRITVDMFKKPKVKELCTKEVSGNCISRSRRSNGNKKRTTNRAAKVVETATTHCAAKDDREEVALNESCHLEILGSSSSVPYDQGIVDKVLPQYGDVASFRVEEKEAVTGTQALAYEEAVQLLINDGEDFENLGTEELPNFSSGFMDVSSMDLEHLFDDGSWSDMMEFIDNVSTSDIVQPMQNMSCSKALGKRKAFEAQDSGPSKKLCM